MYSYDDKIKNRLKRADGQLQGVLRMMNDSKDCLDVVTQLSAVCSSLDNLIGVIVAENLKACMLDDSDGKEEKIERAIHMIVKK